MNFPLLSSFIVLTASALSLRANIPRIFRLWLIFSTTRQTGRILWKEPPAITILLFLLLIPIHSTENGWTGNDTAEAWLRDIFIHQTQLTDPGAARLLILDRHGSHTTTEFVFFCYINKIYLVSIPPHTTHVLKPLDVGVFNPVKAGLPEGARSARAVERFYGSMEEGLPCLLS